MTPLPVTAQRYGFDPVQGKLKVEILKIVAPPSTTSKPPPLPPRHDLTGPSTGNFRGQARDASVAAHHPAGMNERLDSRSYETARTPVVINKADHLGSLVGSLLLGRTSRGVHSHGFSDLAELLLIGREAKKLPEKLLNRHLGKLDFTVPPPRLIETSLPLTDVVRTLSATSHTLVITDDHNAEAMSSIANTFIARHSTLEEVRALNALIKRKNYARIIGVGGGIALDVAKAVALDRELVVVPTILSTNCVSTNRSVLGDGLQSYSFRTATPAATVVSITDMANDDPAQVRRWSQSGFGDLFAEISAAIDIEYRNGTLSKESIEAHDPDVFGALSWAATSFDGWKPETLRYLSELVHVSGLKVLQSGTNADRIGGEHLFYKAMMEVNPDLRRNGPTHGQIVAFGSLVSAYLYGRKTGDMTLLETMQGAFEKMRLPFTWKQMTALGCTKDEIIKAMEHVGNHAKRTIIGDAMKAEGQALLEAVFGPRKFGATWSTITPNHKAPPADLRVNPVLRDTGTIWNAKGFADGRAPYFVADVADHPDFHKKTMPKTFHVCIGKPGSEIRVPDEFKSLLPMIQQAIDFEYSINPKAADCHILLTVDQGPVVAGGSQRTGGLHVDDFQWGRKDATTDELLPKEQVDHSYIFTTFGPTEFFPQPVHLDGLDERKDSITKAFYAQVDTSKPVVPKPFTLNLADGYCIHQAPVAEADGFRTFVRIAFSPRAKEGDGSINLALAT